MKGHGIMTGAGGGRLSIFCQETEPSKDGLWIKDGSISKVVVADLVHGTEESYSTGDSAKISSSYIARCSPPRCAFCAVGNVLYIFRDNTSDALCTQKYDTETGVFTSVTTLTASANAVALYCGGFIYLFGGGYRESSSTYLATSAEVYKVDIETEVTTQIGNMAGAAANAPHALVGSTVYFFGGRTANSAREATTGIPQVYDLETEMASTIGGTFSGIWSIGSVGSMIYLLNHYYYDNDRWSVGRECYKYDTQTGVAASMGTSNSSSMWTTTPDPWFYGEIAPTLSWGSDIYLLGGYGNKKTGNTSEPTHAKNVVRFNTDTELFTMIEANTYDVTSSYPASTKGYFLAPCAQINDKAYLFGNSVDNMNNTLITVFTAAGDNYDLNTAVVHLSEAGVYKPTLMQSGKMTLKPRVKRVMKQTADGLVTVAAAVVENGVATDII